MAGVCLLCIFCVLDVGDWVVCEYVCMCDCLFAVCCVVFCNIVCVLVTCFVNAWCGSLYSCEFYGWMLFFLCILEALFG